MPLTFVFGVLTLAPLVMALALVGLGLARRATIGPALGVTLVGALIPIIGLALLAPEVSAGSRWRSHCGAAALPGWRSTGEPMR